MGGGDLTLHPLRHNSSNVGGVTAGQARHNSSNVGGVTASQVGHNSSSAINDDITQCIWPILHRWQEADLLNYITKLEICLWRKIASTTEHHCVKQHTTNNISGLTLVDRIVANCE